MVTRLDLENVDLQQLASQLLSARGPRVEGAVVGRTWLRDAIVEQLTCSQLEAETLVDTMVTRGFLRAQRDPRGGVEWLICEAPGDAG